ncbi:MAG: glycosyltransferase family 2 protein, partial [Dehalococcoidia bacterium]|nr:glycosyltransferase family 2 protein [Dehalococcoidia bacterium]
MERVSAVILTKNEEELIAGCIESVRWADEILVVDSFSTDRTVEIAEQLGARVERHPFRDFADQRNVAQRLATYDWVLFVDADERVTPELAAEIQALNASGRLNDAAVYHIRRPWRFSGKLFGDDPLPTTEEGRRAFIERHMGRLLDRRRARWERPVHEEVVTDGPRGALRSPMTHLNMSNLSLANESLNEYTDRDAAYLQALGAQTSLADAIFRGARALVYHFTLERAYRKGAVGLLYAIHLG